MFGFVLQKKRDEIRRLLSGRMNREYFRQFRYGDRGAPRGSFCEVVWLIPLAEGSREPICDQAFPVVTKDISHEGLSLIHNAPLEYDRMLVGLWSRTDLKFLLCRCQHSTELGYGFFQIGLHPDEVFHLDQLTIRQLSQHFEALEVATSRPDCVTS